MSGSTTGSNTSTKGKYQCSWKENQVGRKAIVSDQNLYKQVFRFRFTFNSLLPFTLSYLEISRSRKRAVVVDIDFRECFGHKGYIRVHIFGYKVFFSMP